VYVHRIVSGNRKQYVKHFLRFCCQNRRTKREMTVLNLTHWSPERLEKLRAALRIATRKRGTVEGSQALAEVLKLVRAEPGAPLDLEWRIVCALSGERTALARDGRGRFLPAQRYS
jgi:hypothetical protein